MARLSRAQARWWYRLWCCILSGGLLWLSLVRSSQAQITLDGSLGPRGSLTGPNYTIPPEVGQLRGRNLFHSFEHFNLQTGESATFTGPDSIRHILSRVTGGQPSMIDGTLRSTIPGAYLYLLNPSGVLFGPNATLDVQGSFHVSTADYLRLADGTRFVARLSETATLSVAPPAAFGFLGPTAAPITVQGSALSVPAGETLALVGGDLTIAGQRVLTITSTPSRVIPTLGAPGGRIHLASIASVGEVLFPLAEPSAGLEGGAVPQLGPIHIRSGAVLDTSGDGGGTIVIRGGRLLIDHAVLGADTLGYGGSAPLGIDIAIRGEISVTNGSLIGTTTFGPAQGGTIRITASDTVSLASSADLFIPEPDHPNIMSAIVTSTLGAGNAGGIIIEAPRVNLTRGSSIQANSAGSGQGGAVRITASDTVSLRCCLYLYPDS
jgi:filamentous hemagglutinin family protein